MGNSSSSHKSRKSRSLPTSPEVKRYMYIYWKFFETKMWIICFCFASVQRLKTTEKSQLRTKFWEHTKQESPFDAIDVNYKLLHAKIQFFGRTLLVCSGFSCFFWVVCRRWFGKWIWIRNAANGQLQIENILQWKKPELKPRKAVFYGNAPHLQGSRGDKWKWKQENEMLDGKNLNNSREKFWCIFKFWSKENESFTSGYFPFVSLFLLQFFHLLNANVWASRTRSYTKIAVEWSWCTPKMLLDNVVVSEKSETTFGQKYASFASVWLLTIVIKH